MVCDVDVAALVCLLAARNAWAFSLALCDASSFERAAANSSGVGGIPAEQILRRRWRCIPSGRANALPLDRICKFSGKTENNIQLPHHGQILDDLEVVEEGDTDLSLDWSESESCLLEAVVVEGFDTHGSGSIFGSGEEEGIFLGAALTALFLTPGPLIPATHILRDLWRRTPSGRENFWPLKKMI